MGSDTPHNRDTSRRRKHRYEDEYDGSNDHDRVSKRSHQDPDSSDQYSRRNRSGDRVDDRNRRRRRSRSPHPRRRRSRDRYGGRDRRARDSRSPGGESHRDRRGRRGDNDSDDETGDSKRERKRRQSQSAGGRDEYEARNRHLRRGRDVMDDQKPEDNQVAATRGGPLPSQADSFAISKGEEPEKPKEKPNFGTTGHLAAASNSVTQADGTTITLKYHEPPEARKPPPRDQWKLFVFKGKDIVDTIELGTRSCWLVGREPAIVDLLAENPSISKQHAVIQFRYTEKRNEFGDKIGRVKPYLIDLESANGTLLNGEQVPGSRYLELRPKDVVKFGSSEREYVCLLARD